MAVPGRHNNYITLFSCKLAVLAGAGDNKYQALGLLQLPVRFYDDKVPLQEIIWTESGFAQNLHCFQNIFSLLEKSAERYTTLQTVSAPLPGACRRINPVFCLAGHNGKHGSPLSHKSTYWGLPPLPLPSSACWLPCAAPLHVIYNLIPSHEGAMYSRVYAL